MNPRSMSFFRGITAITLIGLFHQASAMAQTETTPPKSDSEVGAIEVVEIDATTPEASGSEKRNLAIEQAFANLRHKKFGVRQAAVQHLANAGHTLLPELETRALTGDVDFQNQCICIISTVGRKMHAMDQAAAALERLSIDPSFNSAGKASEELNLLKRHQVSRAVSLLKEAGVSVQMNNSTGQVYSVRNLTKDEQCEHLKHFSSLNYLTLQGNGVTDACIEPLSKVPNLRQLSLITTGISPAGVKNLKLIPNFTALSVMGTFSAAHIRALTQVPQLSVVQLYTRVGDEELIAAAALPVSQLVFTSFKPSPNTAEIMRNLKAMRLQLSLSGIKNDDLKWLSGNKIPSLHININASKELTDEGMRFLENANISTLSLYNTGITAKAMEQLGTIENLQTLSITNSPIDNESLKHLSNLQQLVSLRLQGTKVTGEGMATLKEKLKNLRSMSPAAIPKKPAK